MNPAVLARVMSVDSAALEAAASIAEEALACHREALILVAEGWQSETGSAIAEFMDRQCSQATDVVDALRRASGSMPAAPDTWTDPGSEPVGGRSVDPADAPPPSAETTGPATAPVDATTPAAPPAPGPVSPWTGQVPSPWAGQVPSPWAAAPVAADVPWAAGSSPAGLPTPPAIPDFGGALVGLVSEIAQALGSYAEPGPSTAPSADDPVGAVDPVTDAPGNPDTAASRDTPPTAPATDDVSAQIGPAAPGSASTAAPSIGSVDPAATPSGSPPGVPLPSATTELLAAERPPEPGTAAPTASAADAAVGAPAPEAPGPPAPEAAGPPAPEAAVAPAAEAAVPDVEPPAAPPPAAAGQTPCEIAADELAKVGE